MPIVTQDPITHAADLLKHGKILAVKGLGGFLLACDATDEGAVGRLRQRKKRAAKPFAVMMASVKDVRGHCHLSREEEGLITSPAAPIVLLERQNPEVICAAVAPNLTRLGVMLPCTPLHHLLLADVGVPLVMTSGNLSEEPIVKDNEEAFQKLSGLVDCILLYNREILTRCDDSIATVEEGRTRLIRRARGYVPSPIRLPFRVKEVLACGAELKNTFCLTRENYGFMSQHVGDMKNLETLKHFESTLELYKRLFCMDPVIVAHDLHPDYLSTHYARQLKTHDPGIQLVAVQHHHAHIVSCMAENHARQPVIGVAFDGTGYGDDGCIWGGEFLLAGYGHYRRIAHLEYVPMPGGQAAVTRPYRMAISYLYKTLGEEGLARGLPFLKDARELEVNLIKKQADAGVNAPMTSSAGRLFDALSSLIGVKSHVDYEAQAAIELEMIADHGAADLPIYPFEIEPGDGAKIIRLGKLFEGVLVDLELGLTRSEISTKCHHTIADLILRTCLILREDIGISRVALSGGVFQNRLLFHLTRKRLEGSGFEVFTHAEVPCNDGGISLGQAVVANFIDAS
jgi:hydrogenase maturation protein HypF